MPKTFTQQQDFAHPWQQMANGESPLLLHLPPPILSLTQPRSCLPSPCSRVEQVPNPHADHVVSVDVLSQTLDPVSGSLRTERIIGVQQGAPTWLKRLVGASDDTYVREVVMVNPLTRSFEMTSTNLSLTDYMLVKEYITYMPKPQGGTSFRQIADIGCTKFFSGMLTSAGRKVEEWSHTRYGDNAAKGRAGLVSVLDSLYGPTSES